MPVAISYPGVYVQPIISPAPTALGVSTSIAAFVGRTTMGPVAEPIMVQGFAEFERLFGGLALDSSLSYAVKAFFDNGGRQAYINRLYAPAYAYASDYVSDTAAVRKYAGTLAEKGKRTADERVGVEPVPHQRVDDEHAVDGAAAPSPRARIAFRARAGTPARRAACA